MCVYVSLLSLMFVTASIFSLVAWGYYVGYERGHNVGRKEVIKEINKKHKATKFVDIRVD